VGGKHPLDAVDDGNDADVVTAGWAMLRQTCTCLNDGGPRLRSRDVRLARGGMGARGCWQVGAMEVIAAAVYW
jgi:hypothetical protein